MSKTNLRMEDCPEYVREKMRMDRLQAEFEKAENEINRMISDRNELMRNPNAAAVSALLDRDPEDIGEEGDITITTTAGIEEQIGELRNRASILKSAINAQRAKFTSAEDKAVAQILPGYLSEYRKIIKRMAEALITVSELVREEALYKQELSLIHWKLPTSLNPVTASRVGSPSDSFSYLRDFLDRACDQGHIPKSMIPKR